MSFKIALVGCGGMGRRHAHGYIELRKYFDIVEMAAVCDVHHDVAATVAVKSVKRPMPLQMSTLTLTTCCRKLTSTEWR